MSPKELTALLVWAFKHNHKILIEGPPGIGKTDIVKQAADQAGFNLVVSHPAVDDPTDWKGLPFANREAKEATFLPFGIMNELIHTDSPTVCFFDDLGQAPASVQAALMQPLGNGWLNGHRISNKVVFVAATNGRAHKAGVGGLLEPVKSRFDTIVTLETSVDGWIDWALKNNMPSELIAYMHWKGGEALHKFEPTKELTNSPCPRTWAKIGNMINNSLPVGEDEVFRGAVGKAFGTEFASFLKVYRDLPRIEDIISKPMKAYIPQKPDVLAALAGALATKMNHDNIDNIVTYINRLPGEIGASCMSLAIKRDVTLSETSGFIKYADKNKDLFL